MHASRFLRAFIGIGLAIALSVAMATYLPSLALPAEILILFLLLLALVRFFPERGGINVVSVIVMLTMLACAVIYTVQLLSYVHPAIVGVVVVLAAGLGVVAQVQSHRRVAKVRREMAGFCGACGYDLRETAERCPECGANIPEDLARRRRWSAMIKARKASVNSRTQIHS